MPFYSRLEVARRQHRQTVKFFIVSHDAEGAIRDVLSRYGVIADGVVNSLETSESIPEVTPVVFVVDSHGTVKRMFVGMVDRSAEKDLIAVVERGA